MDDGTIAIVGSLNLDYIVQVESLPLPGETVRGCRLTALPGGKGGNQAYAVSRLGGRAKLVGCVGQDHAGNQLLAGLKAAGVDVTWVGETSKSTTGTALIAVEKSGQNQIIVVAGANDLLTPTEAQNALARLKPRYLMLQLETPIETVEAAVRQATWQGVTVVLDPAPVRPLSAALLQGVTILTPNESEALALIGHSGSEIELSEAPMVAAQLLRLGPRRVIIKMGAKGAWLADDQQSRHFSGLQVEVVDATAAGDCFNGALTVALAEGHSIDSAINFGNCAAALAVTKLGAQAAIPTRVEVDAYWAKLKS